MKNYNYTKIISSTWIDKDTFLIHFEPTTYFEDGDKFLAQVVAEYHKDDDTFHAEIQYYKAEDGDYIDSASVIMEINGQVFSFICSLVGEELKRFNRERKLNLSHSQTWGELLESDKYEVYDKFVDLIKNFYAPTDDNLAYQIEDEVHGVIANMFTNLDRKYKK